MVPVSEDTRLEMGSSGGDAARGREEIRFQRVHISDPRRERTKKGACIRSRREERQRTRHPTRACAKSSSDARARALIRARSGTGGER